MIRRRLVLRHLAAVAGFVLAACTAAPVAPSPSPALPEASAVRADLVTPFGI
jgi:hypothetical protein